MKEARDILQGILRKRRLLKSMELLLLSLAIGMSVYFLFSSFWVSTMVLLISLSVGLLYIQPWKFTLAEICSHVDETIPPMEHSTGLILENENQLPLLSKIQQARASETLKNHQGEIQIEHALVPIAGFSLLAVLFTWFMHTSGIFQLGPDTTSIPEADVVTFKKLDVSNLEIVPPKIRSQKIHIRYPNYTQKPDEYTTQMNLRVLEGTRISWNISFDQQVNKVQLQMGADSIQMDAAKGYFSKSLVADYASFYAIKFEDSLGNSYVSDLFALETYKDEPPIMELAGLSQFSSFDYNGSQKLSFNTQLKDDFGLTDVAIIATVSKGSGESVKFREERLGFDENLVTGTKRQDFSKTLNLRELNMEPGDELYFYVEAKDNKQPRPNISRTETYFSVIKDTVTNQFAVEGTLGADLMPDYFRSQRQLIIDTEKLIADKPFIETKEFNFRSNELGFDQKALRIKYGEFMGDESEGGPVVVTEVGETMATEDPLAEYTHDHDGSNEHNLVNEEQEDHDHDDHGNEEGEEDPLEAYVHNHEDPEASTLFAQSLKSKLKQAMAEMWDAELYLRLFQPEKSLPYQYKALKLIQEIKNSARIYVHRIGFDPPPIKEDKRLTGDLKEIGNYSKFEAMEKEDLYEHIQKAVARLEILLGSDRKVTKADRDLFNKAGNELASIAIEEPGKYLETLQTVKWLSESENIEKRQLASALRGLYQSLPKKQLLPYSRGRQQNQLNNLFIESLNDK